MTGQFVPQSRNAAPQSHDEFGFPTSPTIFEVPRSGGSQLVFDAVRTIGDEGTMIEGPVGNRLADD